MISLCVRKILPFVRSFVRSSANFAGRGVVEGVQCARSLMHSNFRAHLRKRFALLMNVDGIGRSFRLAKAKRFLYSDGEKKF